VLNNQPQGGFVTRQPTVDVLVESGNEPGDNGFGFGFFNFQRDRNPQTGITRPRGGQYYRQWQPGWQ